MSDAPPPLASNARDLAERNGHVNADGTITCEACRGGWGHPQEDAGILRARGDVNAEIFEGLEIAGGVSGAWLRVVHQGLVHLAETIQAQQAMPDDSWVPFYNEALNALGKFNSKILGDVQPGPPPEPAPDFTPEEPSAVALVESLGIRVNPGTEKRADFTVEELVQFLTNAEREALTDANLPLLQTIAKLRVKARARAEQLGAGHLRLSRERDAAVASNRDATQNFHTESRRIWEIIQRAYRNGGVREQVNMENLEVVTKRMIARIGLWNTLIGDSNFGSLRAVVHTSQYLNDESKKLLALLVGEK